MGSSREARLAGYTPARIPTAIPRNTPTPIDHGIAAWVTTFRKGWLDRAAVPEGERAEVGEAVAARFDDNIADYVRLRFIMRKPD